MPHPRLTPLLLSLAALLAFSLLFPSHTPFIYDEPQFLLLANAFNHTGRIATYALVGSTGKPYGPGAVWFYQLSLLLTHDLVLITALRIAYVLGLTYAGLYALARTTRLWWPGVLFLAASPWVWFYSRMLWDNAFVLAYTTCALAAYVAFLRHPRGYLLVLSPVFAALACLTHLMAVTLPAVLLLHAALYARPLLRPHRKFFALGLLLAGTLSGPYLAVFFTSTYRTEPRPPDPGYATFFLHTPRFLSGTHLNRQFLTPPEYDLQKDLPSPRAAYLHPPTRWAPAFSAVSTATAVLYPLTWAAVLYCAVRLTRRASFADPLHAHLARLGLLTIPAQFALLLATRLTGSTAYFTAVAPFYLLLLWLPLHALAHAPHRPARIATRLAFAALIACSLATSALLLVRIVHTGGNRGGGFGTVLADQIALLKTRARYSPASPVTAPEGTPEVFRFEDSYTAIRVLYRLDPAPTAPTRPLILRYTPGPDPTAGHAEIIEAP